MKPCQPARMDSVVWHLVAGAPVPVELRRLGQAELARRRNNSRHAIGWLRIRRCQCAGARSLVGAADRAREMRAPGSCAYGSKADLRIGDNTAGAGGKRTLAANAFYAQVAASQPTFRTARDAIRHQLHR